MTTRHPGTTQRKWQPQPFVRQPNTTAANNPMHLPASLKDVFLNRMILAAQVAWIPTGQSVTPYYTSVRSTLPWKPGRRPQIVAQKLRFVAFADSALSIDTRVTPLPPQPPSLWDPPHAATIRGSRKVGMPNNLGTWYARVRRRRIGRSQTPGWSAVASGDDPCVSTASSHAPSSHGTSSSNPTTCM
eukprot:gene22549-biopygen23739